MPHLVIELSRKLDSSFDIKKLISQLNKVMIDSSLFDPKNIKIRAIYFDHYLSQENQIENNFIHLNLYLFKGRTKQQLNDLLTKLFDKIAYISKLTENISIHLTEINDNNYINFSNYGN